MKWNNLVLWVAAICVLILALIRWGLDGTANTDPDNHQAVMSDAAPLNARPELRAATGDARETRADIEYDLFLGSGFLIKDCGANGVDIGDGIKRGEIIVRRSGVDLQVSRTSGSEKVICTHFFAELDNTGKAIRFADGSLVEFYDIAGQ